MGVNLNILVVIEKNSWVEFHICESLEALGHRVFRFYFGDYVGEFYSKTRQDIRERKNTELFQLASHLQNEVGIDLIFCYVYDVFLMQKYAKKLRKIGVPLVNYNVDMPVQWFRQIRTARYFDIMLCAQKENMENLARYSNCVLYFPMAARPCIPEKLNNNAFPKHKVSFLGTSIPLRQRLLAELLKNCIDIDIYGKYWNEASTNVIIKCIEKTVQDIKLYGWARLRSEGISKVVCIFLQRLAKQKKISMDSYIIPNQFIHGILSAENIPKLFQNSEINIGLTRLSGENLYKAGHCQMKLRDFEVPMAGGFYLF